MNKEFIPYEQALDLKELGFDEPCLKNWDSGLLMVCDYATHLKAPLYQQAFRFFREKHNLSGNIDCCDKLCEWNIKSSKLDKSIFSNKIQSYEEAELECLKKLIEIVKNK